MHMSDTQSIGILPEDWSYNRSYVTVHREYCWSVKFFSKFFEKQVLDFKKEKRKSKKEGLTVLYPAIFGGCQFFDECSEEKNHCAAG